MTHLKARVWIKPLPCRRGGLDSTAKEILQALWDHARWENERDATGRECRPSREQIAEETGHPFSAVATAVRKLTMLRWISRDGNGWALAWGAPFPEPTRLPEAPASDTRLPEQPAAQGTASRPPEAPATVAQDTATGCPDRHKLTSNELSKEQRHSARGPDPAPLVTSPPKQARPRKTKPPDPAQSGLDLGAPPPDPIATACAELLAEHERLRATALAHHGQRVTAFPKPTSTSGRSLAAGIRAAVRSRGDDWCRRMLAWRGQSWLDDASQVPWSLSTWTKPSLDQAAARMAGGGARASPRNRDLLSCEYNPSATVPRFEVDDDE